MSGTAGLSSIQINPQVSHLKNTLVDNSVTIVTVFWSHTGQWPSHRSRAGRFGLLKDDILATTTTVVLDANISTRDAHPQL